MKEIQSVTADVQHGHVTFRFVDDTEEVVSMRSLIASAKPKTKRGDVDKSARARVERARVLAGQIVDQKARELRLLELTSEEYKRRWLREARNECESKSKKEVGAKRHEKFMALVCDMCNSMYASASR